MQTAQNVQRMTKMQRRQSHSQGMPSMSRMPTFSRIPTLRKIESRLNRSFASVMSEGRSALANSVQFSSRFSLSRRRSIGAKVLDARYFDGLSLGKARYLSNIRAIDQLDENEQCEDVSNEL
ncbi:hypothetical protein PINS_up001147 [Pythium insidiosum]|nr:hypothetical protein PINS_up001147 [Pythium insidiosum]